MADREYIKLGTHEYLGLSREIEIFNENRIKRVESDGITKCKIYLPNDEFQNLVGKLEQLKIQEWKEEYINIHMLNGKEWDFNYNIGGKKKAIHGQNNYPTNFEKVEKIIVEIADKYVHNKFVN